MEPARWCCFFFARPIWHRLNIAVGVPLAWVLGNAFWMLILLLLAAYDQLGIISTVPATILLLLIALAAALVCARKTSIAHLGIVAITLLLLWPVIYHSTESYLIEWDAVAMGFLKAKSFFISPGFTDNVLYRSSSFLYSERSNPIGISLVIAAYYRIIGHVNDQIAQLYMVQWYVLLPLATLGFLRLMMRNVSWLTLWPLTMIMYLAPSYLRHASNGYFDIAIGLVVCVTTGTWLMALRSSDRKEAQVLTLLAIAASGAGGLIKNEGIVLVVLTCVLSLARTEWMRYAVVVAYAWAGIVLWFLIRAHLNIHFYLGNDISLNAMMMRIKPILFHYVDTLVNTSCFGFTLTLLFFATILVSTVFVQKKYTLKLIPFIFPLGLIMSYTIVYLITPLNFNLQLTSSFERLLLQSIPAFFLVIGYCVSILYYKI